MVFRGLIQYGTTYTPAQFDQHDSYQSADAAPLDGSVMLVLANDQTEFSTSTLLGRSYKMSDLSESLAYFHSRTRKGWGRLQYRFVKCQICTTVSGDPVDWFDGSIIDAWINNMKLMGQFATEAGFYGIWLDTEGYNDQWTYNAMPGKSSRALAAYQQRAYEVGYEVAAHWRSINPQLHVMTTFAYEGYVGRLPDIAGSDWGLYKNFLDGLHDAFGELQTITTSSTCFSFRHRRQTTPRAFSTTATGKLILTTEGTYGCTTESCLLRYGLPQINGTFDPASPPPDVRYRGGSSYFGTVNEYGLSLWLDKPSFNPDTPGSNYFTPALFKEMLGFILANCEWCWIYAPTYKFFGSPVVPDAYLSKIREARAEAGLLN